MEQSQHEGAVPLRDQHAIVDRPNFHSEFRSQEIVERTPLHLESKLTPLHDTSMQIEFLHNDAPVQSGRFSGIATKLAYRRLPLVDDRVQLQYQAGFVVISIAEVHADDAGIW